MKSLNGVAYIDAANLYKGIGSLKWKLDYFRFRVWLKDKYKVSTAYLFIGFLSDNKKLYDVLQKAGFVLVYKEVTYDGDGKIKGNCDADLVLKVAVDFYENKLSQAVIVTNDGDYAGLCSFLKGKNVLRTLISPSKKCSYLLRKLNIPIVYLDTQKSHLERP